MGVEWFIVAILATWRITSILHHEAIALPLRKWLGQDKLGSYPNTFVGKLWDCFWCLSIWVGIVCTVILWLFPPLLVPFALSAGALWIERLINPS